MTTLHDKIIHVNCEKELSEEAIKYINRMVEIAYSMSEDELKALNEKDAKIRKQKSCKHKWTYFCGTPQNETDQCIHCGKLR